MSNLNLLMKANIINEFGLNKIKSTKGSEKTKMISMVLIILFAVAVLVVYGFALCFKLADMLIVYNQAEVLLIMGVLGATAFALFTSLYKASSYLFQARDYEMLVSLPIEQNTILTSKILMLVFTNYLFSSAFILIPGIVYFIKVDTYITYIPYLIILFLSVPLIPIVISAILSIFIGNISSRMRYKNAVLIGLNILLLVAALYFSYNLENLVLNIVNNSSSIIEVSRKIYFLSYYFVDALKNNNIVSLIIFVSTSLVVFIGFTIIFGKTFNEINSRMKESYKAKSYQFKELKTSKPINALVKKEFKKYFSSYAYFLNSSVGMILLPIFSIGIVFLGPEKISEILQMDFAVEMIKVQVVGVILLCMMMTYTTSISTSLEGKNLWILKSSPIDEYDIFKAKVYFNLILIIPVPIISFLIMAVKLKFDITYILIIVCTIIVFGVFVSLLGLFINLLYPKVDFTNEIQVVKQSASVMLYMLISLIYVAIFVGIFYILKMKDLNVMFALSTGITVISNLILWKLIKSKGVRLFRTIS